jgi:hypothetical protein
VNHQKYRNPFQLRADRPGKLQPTLFLRIQKSFRKDKEFQYILIKGTILQKDLTILNTYTPTSDKHFKSKGKR